jgi:DNA modification methylase
MPHSRHPRFSGPRPSGPRPPLRPKLALTNVGGRAELSGDPETARSLALALAVEPGAGLDRWTHGFHTYAARMHPDTAGRLVRSLSAPGTTVLDPFCGSGTVVLEAFVSGRRALGRDLNPVAVRLAAVRAAVVSDGRRKVVRDRAHRIAAIAMGRVRQGHVPPGPRVPGAELFDSRTFAELSWLLAGIAADRDPFVRDALEMVLSSILVKVSCRTSDTDSRLLPRCRAPGSASRIFGYKVDELCRRWKALREALRDDALHPDLAVDDARRLRSVADASVDLVVTSPPYANVYDYAEQHELRAAWLGLDEGPLQANEVGARRTFRNPKKGLERWEQDGSAWVAAVARTLRSGGRACILGGDGATDLGPVRFDECLARWASAAGLAVAASAAQRRPTFDEETRRAFHGSPRREHLIVLRK